MGSGQRAGRRMAAAQEPKEAAGAARAGAGCWGSGRSTAPGRAWAGRAGSLCAAATAACAAGAAGAAALRQVTLDPRHMPDVARMRAPASTCNVWKPSALKGVLNIESLACVQPARLPLECSQPGV